MDQGDRYFSIERASEYLSLSLSYVQKLTARRRIPFIKVGKRCLYDRALLDRWMQRKAQFPKDWAGNK